MVTEQKGGITSGIPFHDEDLRTSTLGEIPGGIPKILRYEGKEPKSLSAYSRLVKKLNDGIPLRDAIKRADEIRILFRDSTGWKIAAGTTFTLGAAVVLATVTRRIIRDSRKPRR